MGMNKLNTAERVQIIRCLVEGNSVNSTSRITGRSKHTVLNLLADIGAACQKLHDDRVRGIAIKRLQVDEVWNFCHCKQKNVPAEKRGQFGYGDVWTWTAVDADTKLIVSYLVGGRGNDWAQAFMDDVADRVINRFQLTSDGHRSYLEAVENTFGGEVDYAQLIKVYGKETRETQARYSPGVVLSVELHQISGEPDPAHISTSFVERSNLTMRMSMRRFTRLTNAFSKKIENMRHAVALNFVYYTFCRIHQTLRVTPAMEAGLAHHVWELEELVSLIG
jgi:IS1 family transposase